VLSQSAPPPGFLCLLRDLKVEGATKPMPRSGPPGPSATGRKRTFGLSARLGESGRQHEWGSGRRLLPDYAAILPPQYLPAHRMGRRLGVRLLPLLKAPNGPNYLVGPL